VLSEDVQTLVERWRGLHGEKEESGVKQPAGMDMGSVDESDDFNLGLSLLQKRRILKRSYKDAQALFRLIVRLRAPAPPLGGALGVPAKKEGSIGQEEQEESLWAKQRREQQEELDRDEKRERQKRRWAISNRLTSLLVGAVERAVLQATGDVAIPTALSDSNNDSWAGSGDDISSQSVDTANILISALASPLVFSGLEEARRADAAAHVKFETFFSRSGNLSESTHANDDEEEDVDVDSLSATSAALQVTTSLCEEEKVVAAGLVEEGMGLLSHTHLPGS